MVPRRQRLFQHGTDFARLAQLDRAPDYESGGRRFESFIERQNAHVAQLDRAPGYEPDGQRFESSRGLHYSGCHGPEGHLPFYASCVTSTNQGEKP